MRRNRHRVDFSTQEVVKILPSMAPTKGERVLVDGKLCRVVKCRYTYEGDLRTIHELVVTPIEGES